MRRSRLHPSGNRIPTLRALGCAFLPSCVAGFPSPVTSRVQTTISARWASGCEQLSRRAPRFSPSFHPQGLHAAPCTGVETARPSPESQPFRPTLPRSERVGSPPRARVNPHVLSLSGPLWNFDIGCLPATNPRRAETGVALCSVTRTPRRPDPGPQSVLSG